MFETRYDLLGTEIFYSSKEIFDVLTEFSSLKTDEINV